MYAPIGYLYILYIVKCIFIDVHEMAVLKYALFKKTLKRNSIEHLARAEEKSPAPSCFIIYMKRATSILHF